MARPVVDAEHARGVRVVGARVLQAAGVPADGKLAVDRYVAVVGLIDPVGRLRLRRGGRWAGRHHEPRGGDGERRRVDGMGRVPYGGRLAHPRRALRPAAEEARRRVGVHAPATRHFLAAHVAVAAARRDRPLVHAQPVVGDGRGARARDRRRVRAVVEHGVRVGDVGVLARRWVDGVGEAPVLREREVGRGVAQPGRHAHAALVVACRRRVVVGVADARGRAVVGRDDRVGRQVPVLARHEFVVVGQRRRGGRWRARPGREERAVRRDRRRAGRVRGAAAAAEAARRARHGAKVVAVVAAVAQVVVDEHVAVL
ncbi:MAG: hypothetical protein ACKVI4_16025, partial [Actinomycetales bacterium]